MSQFWIIYSPIKIRFCPLLKWNLSSSFTHTKENLFHMKLDCHFSIFIPFSTMLWKRKACDIMGKRYFKHMKPEPLHSDEFILFFSMDASIRFTLMKKRLNGKFSIFALHENWLNINLMGLIKIDNGLKSRMYFVKHFFFNF